MTVLVHFSGPSYSKTAVLEPGAAPIEVGRDPEAGVYLPDQDRLISRRHLSIRWNQAGVQVEVLSKVNGVTTSSGDFAQGQSVVVPFGDKAQIGHFTFVAERAAGEQPASAGSSVADDPFRFLAGPVPSGPRSVFDDPFFLPNEQPRQVSRMETPAALDAMSGKAAHAPVTFSGGATDPRLDPLAAFGGAQAPAHSSVSIDEFLGPSTARGGGLGAAQLLKTEPEKPRRLATDHVHDFALPVRGPIMQPSPSTSPQIQHAPPDFDALNAWAPQTGAGASAAPLQEHPAGTDPWTAFAQEWPPQRGTSKSAEAPAQSLNHALDDAFSSSTAWRVEDMPAFHPPAQDVAEASQVRAPSTQPPQTAAAPGCDAGHERDLALRALCKGLGISGPTDFKEVEWEQLGQSVRQIVQGLSELMNVRSELKREMRAIDRTMLGAQENNPLKSGMSIDELLQYLLFMPEGAAGYMPVRRALDQSIEELRAHEFASLAAVRAVVEGSIGEFEPSKLRNALLKGKRSIGILDNARLWDLYTAHYEHKREAMADWLEQVFSRHFMPAYSRESDRLRRESLAQRQGAAPSRGQ